ncbi:MAG: 5-oxoprolinase, partial [Acidobacteria bacterium]
MTVRVGVDVGGTFTDVVCFDEQNGKLALLKQPSTPKDPSEAVLAGTRRILAEIGVAPDAVSLFFHGTTVATNALLERKGCRVALLVTEGFRDVLQIMRQDRPRLYDYFVARPEPLVPRHLRFEASERMLWTGEVHRPLDVAVCLLHSYANSTHEEQLRQWLEAAIPGVRVSLSSEILPEFKEFERMSTTVVNAYVLPEVSDYMNRLQGALREMRTDAPLQIMQSNGGLMTAARASRHGVETILSGPAAGALTGLRLAQQAGVVNMISIDVGGTSADVALGYNGQLRFAEESDIGGYLIKVPSIEIQTVGAGGGSIAWTDAGGSLQVGPYSAGAEPGPTCYGRGGSDPTVTDANLILGRLSAGYFLGGRMRLDPERARQAILDKLAGPLNLSLEQAAEGVLRVINAVMAKVIRRLSVERGYDPREFTLISFGGGGPLQAVDLALDLQFPKVLIPPTPGVSSALGLLTADFRHDYVRTLLWRTNSCSLEELHSHLTSLRRQAQVQMAEEGLSADSTIFWPQLDMRYA